MTWTRLDDNVTDHPKIIAVGHLAELAYYRSIVHANRYETDGFIAQAVVKSLCRGFERQAQRIAQALVGARLWAKCKGGYRIHDFHDYQPAREKVEAHRRATAARVRAWRDRHAYADGQGDRNAVTQPLVTPPPYPYPYPSRPRSSLKNRRTGGAGGPLDPAIQQLAAKMRMP